MTAPAAPATSGGAVHNPIFARVMDRLSRRGEELGAAEHRRELLRGLSGRVVELGSGNGVNFKHYPVTVSEVVAVEPEAYLRARARSAAAEAPVPVTVVDALGGALPFEDSSFDAAVTALVLCSVPDPHATLCDLLRVLRPGGELRFYEHVRAHDPGLARIQDRVAPLWSRLAGGCRPNRDTEATILGAGFTIERAQRFPFRPSFVCAPVAPHVLGVARRPRA